MAQQSIYGAFPDTYAAFSEHSGPNAGYDRPAILQLAGEVAGQRVLELGCAGGVLTEHLVDRGADVLALDREPRMVELARQRVGERARVVVAELEQPLQMVPTSMDVVVASLVLLYIADWTPVLDELHRCLAPGGALVFSIHHPITGWARSDQADYHRTERITEEWNWDGQPVTGTLYRRPLSVRFSKPVSPSTSWTNHARTPTSPRPRLRRSSTPNRSFSSYARGNNPIDATSSLPHPPATVRGGRWFLTASGTPWRTRRRFRSPMRRVGSPRCVRLKW